MASPSIRSSNVWQVEGGDDILQIKNQSGTNLGGIDSTGAGFGSLAGGVGTPAGIDTQIQFNNLGAFGADSRLVFQPVTGNFTVNGLGSKFITSGDSNLNRVIVQLGDILVVAGEVGSALAMGSDGPMFMSSFSDSVSLRSAASDKIIEVDSSGNLGFFGKAPATQPSTPVTLGDVIAALRALGLVA